MALFVKWFTSSSLEIHLWKLFLGKSFPFSRSKILGIKREKFFAFCDVSNKKMFQLLRFPFQTFQFTHFLSAQLSFVFLELREFWVESFEVKWKLYEHIQVEANEVRWRLKKSRKIHLTRLFGSFSFSFKTFSLVFLNFSLSYSQFFFKSEINIFSIFPV